MWRRLGQNGHCSAETSPQSERCKLQADGLPLYRSVPFYLGSRCSFAQLTKTYSATQTETKSHRHHIAMLGCRWFNGQRRIA